MSIKKRREGVYLIRVYLGREPITKKRIQINETFHGKYDEAVKRETILKGKVYSGEVVRPSHMTVNSLLDIYLAARRHSLSAQRLHQHTTHWRTYVRPYIGDRKIEKLTAVELQELFNFYLDPKKGKGDSSKPEGSRWGLGLAVNTAKTVRDGLSAAFNFAYKGGYIKTNPVSGTKLPKAKPSAATSFTIEEALAFVHAKDQYWYGDAFVLQLHTGVRNAELMALIWDDVDFDAGELRIERACKWIGGRFTGFGPTKTGESRYIDLGPRQLELLRAHRDKQRKDVEEATAAGLWVGEPKMKEWLASERGRQYRNTNLVFPSYAGNTQLIQRIRDVFKAMLIGSGCRVGLRWYDLRHTNATFLLTMGVPEHEVAARLGHSVRELQDTYSHVLPKRQRRASILFEHLVPTTITKAITGTEIDTHLQNFINKTKEEFGSFLEDTLGQSGTDRPQVRINLDVIRAAENDR